MTAFSRVIASFLGIKSLAGNLQCLFHFRLTGDRRMQAELSCHGFSGLCCTAAAVVGGDHVDSLHGERDASALVPLRLRVEKLQDRLGHGNELRWRHTIVV